MESISAIVGVSVLAYLLDQRNKEMNFEEVNSIRPEEVIVNTENKNKPYQWNFENNFSDEEYKFNNYKENFQNINNNYPSNQSSNQPSPLIPMAINSPQQIEAINIKPSYETNLMNRPIDDFTINNMVPHIAKVTQDMRGTGVSQSNINSKDYNLGNNNDTVFHTKLSTFTGIDDTYLHKRETPAFYSPLEQRTNSQLPIDDPGNYQHDRSRYTTSILYKPDEQPFEKIQVGPGINIDPDMPNDGLGFNSGLNNRVMPNNVNAYKLSQFSGRISGTSWQGPSLPESLPGIGQSFSVNSQTGETNDELYGVPKTKPLTYYTQEDYPMAHGGGIINPPTWRSEQILPSGTSKRVGTQSGFGNIIEVK